MATTLPPPTDHASPPAAPAQAADATKQDHLPAWTSDDERAWTGDDNARAWKQEG